ncbi:MAG: hypothetical protein JWR59_1689 [Brevundimonas sp.]|nr:hypothetical protein [Brevundimonas sp.]
MRQKRLFAEPQQHDIQEPSLVAERSLFRHGRGAGRDYDGRPEHGSSRPTARLRPHSQKSTVAARAMADRKTIGHRS